MDGRMIIPVIMFFLCLVCGLAVDSTLGLVLSHAGCGIYAAILMQVRTIKQLEGVEL